MIKGAEILWSFCFIITFVLSRIIYLLAMTRNYSYSKRIRPAKTIICIGSGGHTTEMIKLVQNLNTDKYKPRYYILAKSDNVSEDKVLFLERQIYNCDSDYSILKIPRSRIVNQSYITSIFTTLYSILYCIPVVISIKPDLILTNGPGTCIPICVIAFLMKVFFLCDSKIIFIESICRVESLSLSGKILNIFADKIVVQWEELQKCYSNTDYLGQLY